MEPDNAFAYFGLGIAWSEFGMHEEAIAELDRMIELQPEIALAYGNRTMPPLTSNARSSTAASSAIFWTSTRRSTKPCVASRPEGAPSHRCMVAREAIGCLTGDLTGALPLLGHWICP